MHTPVQLQVVFNNISETSKVDEVTSTGRLEVSNDHGQMRITDPSQIEVMVQVYRHIIVNADQSGIHVIVIPFGPYQVDANLVNEYTRVCMEAIAKEVINS